MHPQPLVSQENEHVCRYRFVKPIRHGSVSLCWRSTDSRRRVMDSFSEEQQLVLQQLLHQQQGDFRDQMATQAEMYSAELDTIRRERAASSGAPPDQRLGRPTAFDGEGKADAKFQVFAFKYISYVALDDMAMTGALHRLEEDSRTEVQLSTFTPEEREAARRCTSLWLC